MNFLEFQQSELSQKPHFLLFGNPVSHSLSPIMHNLAASYYGINERYHAVKLESSGFGIVATHMNSSLFKGANITIPYKEILLEYVDGLDVTASAIGAINTIVKKDLKLIGYNTDSFGFLAPLEDYADELMGGRAIIFGTGGATKAIIYALHKFGMEEIVLISRKPDQRSTFNYEDDIWVENYDSWFDLAEDAKLIVNATPLGMHPDTDSTPIREEEKEILSSKICYDIVYNPQKTKFLKLAEAAGARTIGGLEMLIHQGSRSFELWTGKSFPFEKVRKKLYETIEN